MTFDRVCSPRSCRLAFVVPLLLLVSACSGDGRPEVHPVQGRVTFRKTPAASAVVVLRPVDSNPLKDILPHGAVRLDGTFKIGTYEADDGAPEGEYVVTITWPRVSTDEAGDELITDRLRGRFANPSRSQWKIHVNKGTNTLEPFQVD
jgi:hypothetical protein